MIKLKAILSILFCCVTCLASSLPLAKVEKFFIEQPPIPVSGVGDFTFITNAGAAGFLAPNTLGHEVDMTGAKLLVVTVYSYSPDPTVFWSVPANTFIAKTPIWTGTGTLTNQQFYCITPTVNDSMYFVASNANGDESLLGFVVEGFGCTGTPAYVSETGAGNSTATTLQPGSQTPASGTNLFVAGAVVNDEIIVSIDSSFSALVWPVGDGSVAQSWKNSATAENPTFTFGSQGATARAAATMLMFSASGGGGGGIAKIFSTAAGGTSGGCITAPATNTAGSTVLIDGMGGYRSPLPTGTDSVPNSWTRLTETAAGGGSGAVMGYVLSPTTSGSHTFSADGGDVGTAYSSVGALGFSGVTAFGAESGMATNGILSGGSIILPTLTPSASTSVFVTVLGWDVSGVTVQIDSSFIIDYQGYSANGLGFAIAHKIKTGDSSAESPVWSVATGSISAVMSARMGYWK